MKCEQTLDSYLWHPLNNIVSEPKESFFWWLLVNVVFVSFGEMNWAIAHYLTIPGLVGFYMVIIYMLIQFIIRSIAFPMSNKFALRTMERQIAKDQRKFYLKKIYTFRTFLVLMNSLDCLRNVNNIVNQPYWTEAVLKCQQAQSLLEFILLTCQYELNNSIDTPNHKRILKLLVDHLSNMKEVFEYLSQDPSSSNHRVLLLKHILSLELLSYFLEEYQEKEEEKIFSILANIAAVNTINDIQTIVDSHRDMFNVYCPKKKVCSCISCQQRTIEEGEIIGTEIEVNEKTPLLNLLPKKNSYFTLVFNTLYGYFQDYRKSYKPMQAVFNLEYHRLSLEVSYLSYPIQIPLESNRYIDGIIIYGKKQYSIPLPMSLSELSTLVKSKKMIIICNPNAAVYEYARLQYEFLDFYLENNINVFLFNYRGYGASKDYPTPTKNQNDAKTIVEFLVSNNLAVKWEIGVHAMSIGGLMAAELCSKREELGISLFVFDRSFASLSATAGAMVHPFTTSIVRDIAGWHGNNVFSFLQGTTLSLKLQNEQSSNEITEKSYFIVACDPNDEIIHNEVSLKVGVAREIMNQALFSNSLYNTQYEKCKTNVLACKDKSSFEDTLENILLEILRSPTFSIDVVSNILSLQTKLQALFSLPNLTSCQKQTGVTVAGIFQNVLGLNVCGITLQDSTKQYLMSHPMETMDKERKSLVESKAEDMTDPIRDWFYCLLIWQNHNKLTANVDFVEMLKHISLTFKNLSLHNLKACDSLKIRDEVDFFSELWSSVFEMFLGQTRNDIAFIPLTCGHNNPFKRREWKAFVTTLGECGWI